jgi:hypothetical protein
MIYFVQGAKISPHEMISILRDSQEEQGICHMLSQNKVIDKD